MIGRLRSWFSESRAADVPQDYTSLLLAQTLAAARGIDGIKSSAAYRGGLELIGHSAGVATLTGQHSGALQGNLSTIARAMIDTGQSDWLINIGSTGAVVSVACHGFECSRRAGPEDMDLHIDNAGADPDGDLATEWGSHSQFSSTRRSALEGKASD